MQSLEEIRDALSARSVSDKKKLLRQLVAELQGQLGETPVAICDHQDEERVVGYFVPVQAWLRMEFSGERLERLDRRMRNPGETASLAELMRRLQAQES